MTNGNGAPQEAPAPSSTCSRSTQGSVVRKSERPGLAGAAAGAAGDHIQINVGANTLADSEFEVTLSIEGKAETARQVMFSFDLAYAGVFRIVNVPQETCTRW